MSGNDSNEEHLLKISEILLAFDILHFDLSGKYLILVQPSNSLDIYIPFCYICY